MEYHRKKIVMRYNLYNNILKNVKRTSRRMVYVEIIELVREWVEDSYIRRCNVGEEICVFNRWT